MGFSEEQQRIIDLINMKVNELNSKYPNIISNDLRNAAINKYINCNESIESIDKEITSILTTMERTHEEQLAQINSVESFNPNELDTGLKTNSQGVYLSSLMTTVLSLINCSNIDEINKWIDSVPNLYMVSPIQNGDYSPEQIETVKRKLFDMYQNTMISTDVVKEINNNDREEAMRYALHKKISGLNLSLEDELKLGDLVLSQGFPVLFKEIEKLCVEKYGNEKGSKISNKIVFSFTTDYENFNSATYEQMQALNEEIKSNIQKCKSTGGDFQLVIRSLGYGNTVNDKGNGNFEYNFETSEMGQVLAEKLGSSYRLRSMINRNAADEMISKGFTKADKEVVIQILRDSLSSSLQSFNSNIKDDGRNRTFELFNELVEINKADKNFKCVWEDRFGITLEDLVKQVVGPNMQLIKELKSKNVDFMYNETMLQEAPEKRARVMETMIELQRLAPGLITVFGDQDHTFSSDYSEEKIGQLKATAEFDKQMANMVFGKDANGNDIKVKLECTERDLYLSQREIKNLEQKGMSKQDILKYKQGLMNRHAEIFRDVPFERECEWTVVDNISGDYFKGNFETNKDSYMGKYTKISSMAKKDNSERINKDITEFSNWKKSVSDIKQQKEQSNSPKKEESKKSFDQRSQTEVQIAQQIREKNKMIKQQKQAQKLQEKGKVKTMTKKPFNTSNTGYVNSLVLSLIISFLAGALFMIIYMIIGGK